MTDARSTGKRRRGGGSRSQRRRDRRNLGKDSGNAAKQAVPDPARQAPPVAGEEHVLDETGHFNVHDAPIDLSHYTVEAWIAFGFFWVLAIDIFREQVTLRTEAGDTRVVSLEKLKDDVARAAGPPADA